MDIDVSRHCDWMNHGYWINPQGLQVINPVKVVVDGYRKFRTIDMYAEDIELRYYYLGSPHKRYWRHSAFFFKTKRDAVEAALKNLKEKKAQYGWNSLGVSRTIDLAARYLAVSGKDPEIAPGTYYGIWNKSTNALLCTGGSSSSCAPANWYAETPSNRAELFLEPSGAHSRIKSDILHGYTEEGTWRVVTVKINKKGDLWVDPNSNWAPVPPLKSPVVRALKKLDEVNTRNSNMSGYAVVRKKDQSFLNSYLGPITTMNDLAIYDSVEAAQQAIFQQTKMQREYEVVKIALLTVEG